jgi:hypothetical protein
VVEGTQPCPNRPLHNQACGDPPSPPGPTPAGPTPPPGTKPPPPAVFTLDIASPSTKDVTLTVQTPARIVAKIIHSGGPVGGNVTLDVSSFVIQQGAIKPVTLSVDGGADLGKSHLDEVAFTSTARIPG